MLFGDYGRRKNEDSYLKNYRMSRLPSSTFFNIPLRLTHSGHRVNITFSVEKKNKVAKHAHVFINHTLMIWFISFLLPHKLFPKKVLHTKRIVSCFHWRLEDGSILYPQLIDWWSLYTFMDFSSPNVLLCVAAVSQKSSTGVKKCRWQIISQRFFRQLAKLCACNGWKVLKKSLSQQLKRSHQSVTKPIYNLVVGNRM